VAALSTRISVAKRSGSARKAAEALAPLASPAGRSVSYTLDDGRLD